MCVCVLSLQLCPTLCDPVDYRPPGSSVHGILQAKIQEWVAMCSSRASSRPRDQTLISYTSLHWQAGSLLLVLLGKPSPSPPLHETWKKILRGKGFPHPFPLLLIIAITLLPSPFCLFANLLHFIIHSISQSVGQSTQMFGHICQALVSMHVSYNISTFFVFT